MATLLSGAAFGAALVASGVYQPSVITSQFTLENWHMIQAFLTATAGSTLIVLLADRLGYARLKPRTSAPVGLFSRFDGNVLGGLLQGLGMALSGACPGTTLAQTASGLRTGFYATAGAVLGGIAWSGILAPAVQRRRQEMGQREEKATVYEQLGVSKATSVLGFESICVAVVAVTTLWGPESPYAKVAPVVGGVLISLAQLLSLVARKSLVGVSGSYEEAGKHFWRLLNSADPGIQSAGYGNILFSVGLLSGAWALIRAEPSFAAVADARVTPATAVMGGALMVIGARLSGGCSSGHGISGISLLSTSSFITIGVAFGSGILLAPLLY